MPLYNQFSTRQSRESFQKQIKSCHSHAKNSVKVFHHTQTKIFATAYKALHDPASTQVPIQSAYSLYRTHSTCVIWMDLTACAATERETKKHVQKKMQTSNQSRIQALVPLKSVAQSVFIFHFSQHLRFILDPALQSLIGPQNHSCLRPCLNPILHPVTSVKDLKEKSTEVLNK